MHEYLVIEHQPSALLSTDFSTSRPERAISPALKLWSTLMTFWVMIGPSSKSLVTKWAVAPMIFTPAFKCLLVWFGTDKGWQKAMVDIDDLVRKLGDKVRCQDPHIFGQHDIIRAVLLDGLKQFLFVRFTAQPSWQTWWNGISNFSVKPANVS